jgi:hypothetical protein
MIMIGVSDQFTASIIRATNCLVLEARRSLCKQLAFLYVPDGECASVPDDLDFEKIFWDAITIPPNVTITTPFPLPAWPKSFGPVDYTHNLILGYAVLSVLWAVTSLIIVGKQMKLEL